VRKPAVSLQRHSYQYFDYSVTCRRKRRAKPRL